MSRSTVKAAMLGAAASALVLGAASALAGTGVGGIFNLGEKNAVNAASRLVGSVQAPQLAVTNANAGGSGLRALHSAGSGSAPGLWGDTGSSGGGALGVLGRVLPASAAASSAAVKGLNQGKGMGVYGRNPNNVPSGYGVVGEGRYGLVGRSLFSGASSGVWASSPQGFAGVEGHSGNAGGFGVYGQNTSGGPGVFGTSAGGYGVWGRGSYGVVGGGSQGGVWATTGNASGSGVYGQNTNGSGTGVRGSGGNGGWFSSTVSNGTGVLGTVTGAGHGVRGEAGDGGTGVRGIGGNGGWFSSTVSNGTGVLGTVTGAGHGVRGAAGSGGAGVYGTTSGGGWAFQANGDAAQSRGGNGWAKAMLAFDPYASDKIRQCYNSQLPPAQATAGDCGITIVMQDLGEVRLDFGFDVSDRFLLVMPQYESCTSGCAAGGGIVADAEPVSGDTNRVDVSTMYNGGNWTNARFYLFVF